MKYGAVMCGRCGTEYVEQPIEGAWTRGPMIPQCECKPGDAADKELP